MSLSNARTGAGLVVIGLVLAGLTLLRAQEGPKFVRVSPQDAHWVDVPDGLGLQTAMIEGDPAKPGIYVIWNRFPPGVMSRPHYHTTDRYATVIKGTWWTGTGNEFTPDKTIPLKAGSYMKHPAGAAHFDGAKDEEVILQIVGTGPVESPRIRPQDGGYGYSLKK